MATATCTSATTSRRTRRRLAYILKVTSSGILSIFAGTGEIGSETPGTATSSKLNFPTGLAVDTAGDLYVADTYSNLISKITPLGSLSIVAGDGQLGPSTAGPATASALNNPGGVAVDGTGNVYVADAGNNIVEKVTPGGSLSIFAGDGQPGAPTTGPALSTDLSAPIDVATDRHDNVFIADEGNDDVEEVSSGLAPPPSTTTTTGVPVTLGHADPDGHGARR